MPTSSYPPLPKAVDAYFTGKNARDFSHAISGFAPTARVKDEHRDHIGADAIAAWIADSAAKYNDQVTVLSAVHEADAIVVSGEVAGTFPGSPITLRFRFTMADDAIAELSIAP